MLHSLLSNHPTFASLTGEHLRRLAEICEAVTYDAGEVVFTQGQPASGALLLTKGRVEVLFEHDARTDSLSMIDAGELIGELSLVDAQPRSATLVARARCEGVFIPLEGFERLRDDLDPAVFCLIREISRTVCARIRAAEVEIGAMLASADLPDDITLCHTSGAWDPVASDASNDDAEGHVRPPSGSVAAVREVVHHLWESKG